MREEGEEGSSSSDSESEEEEVVKLDEEEEDQQSADERDRKAQAKSNKKPKATPAVALPPAHEPESELQAAWKRARSAESKRKAGAEWSKVLRIWRLNDYVHPDMTVRRSVRRSHTHTHSTLAHRP